MSNFRQPSNTTPSGMASGAANRFRTGRNMPSWVTESSDRVGPPPPPPPVNNNDPEYEVIDVVNQQQYSNAPPPVPLKSPDIKRLTVMKCDLCGSVTPVVRCEQCDQNLFCASCDDRYHRHPKRQTHVRKPLEPPVAPITPVKPPLPPKGEAGSSGPLPPPRRNKRPGSFHFPSPMFGRKQDEQTIPTTVPQGQQVEQQQSQQQKPPAPPPSPALSLREKMNSLKRFIHPSNRPLPDPPENKIHSSNSSLDTVSKRSPSIGPSSRSVSSTMAKIQNNTAATLDRMTLLQQRYRQHQEAMKSDGDRSRRASLTSNTDLQHSEFGDSMSAITNGPRSLSTSVFNLHQPQPPQANVWGFNPLHQAQSMAHFNPMQWNQMNTWMGRGSQNGSNMSLNLPPQHGYPPHDPSGYPPGWANAWNGMYPYPMGMMPMMPGVAMPPPRSRANSRSRAASPALSIKSRKSTMSMRNLNRNSFVDDLTDDEDSDDGFHRARGGRGGDRRRRERLNSTSSIDFDEPEPPTQSFMRASSVKHSRFNRDRRGGGGSSARSLIDYPVSRKPTREEPVRERFDKMALSAPRKVPSDSFTNESDQEPEGRRTGSNRSRSGNESVSSPRKPHSDSMTNDSDADFERRRQAKLKAAQNNLAATRRITSDSHTNDSEPDQARQRQKSKPLPAAPKKPVPSSDSDGRDKQRRKSDSRASAPKKIPSDSHTPDTDGSEQRRRFASKQQRQRKNSSTEFIANESDEEKVQKVPATTGPQQQKVVNGLLEFRTISPTKSDSDEQRHMKTVEIKNIINDTRTDADYDAEQETLEHSPPPPAPVAPDREWECAFCTYVNEPGVKICAICCKTATLDAVSGGRQEDGDGQPRSPPPDVVQETPQVTEVKLQIVPPQTKTIGATNDDDDEMDTEIVDRGVEVVKSCSDSNDENRFERVASNRGEPVEKTMVVKEKVSTGCGPSPPRETGDGAHRTAPSGVDRSHARTSIGTSPPPQDMSTQTYDTLEQVRHEIATQNQPSDDTLAGEAHQEQTLASSALYKRSYSLATPQLLEVERPASRNSISSDTQSLPPSPHELSPQPGLQSSSRYHANQALNQTSHPTPSSSTSSHRYGPQQQQQQQQHQDESLSYLDRAIHQIIQTAANQTLGGATVPEENMYRTFNDLRRIDSMTPAKTTVASATVPPKQAMRPTKMDDRQDLEEVIQRADQPTGMQNGSIAKEEPSELTLLLREAERYQFTAEELQAAMIHCGEKHPVQWLRTNWNKLIETVQTLATKYGHEKRENIIGTISTVEAREALRMHKGNIWRAITECIEQRQRKYHEIASKGNFTREDIVTSLTAHHGSLEQALVELSKTQLKPFLMRIWGPPSGADNDSGNLLLQQALQEDRSGISSEIQQFISAHVEKELLGEGPSDVGVIQTAQPEEPIAVEQTENGETEPEIQQITSPENSTEPSRSDHDHEHHEEVCEEQTTTTSNTEILKDIEALILQMERKQESTNAPVLRNIQQLLSQLVDTEGNSRSPSVTSVRSQASDQRIMSKSPIPVRNAKPAHSPDPNRTIQDDVRDFVQENIQDILPNLVQQVRQELDAVKVNLRTKPRSLEDDIRETLMRAEYSDNDYSNIHYFPFDEASEPASGFPERQTTMKTTTTHQATTVNDESDEYANIQQFLERAIRNEKTTTMFDQMKRSNYLIDSSSDEARQTAESTDYYDLVSINEKLMNLFTKPPSKEAYPVEQKHTVAYEETLPVASSSTSRIVLDKIQPVKDEAEPHTPEELQAPQVEATNEKKGMKKRRGSRIPINKNNYLCRRPVKSSSESDFEVLAVSTKPHQAHVGVIDHVEEMRHVVENIERIEQTVNVDDAAGTEEEEEDFELIDEPIYINLPSKPTGEGDVGSVVLESTLAEPIVVRTTVEPTVHESVVEPVIPKTEPVVQPTVQEFIIVHAVVESGDKPDDTQPVEQPAVKEAAISSAASSEYALSKESAVKATAVEEPVVEELSVTEPAAPALTALESVTTEPAITNDAAVESVIEEPKPAPPALNSSRTTQQSIQLIEAQEGNTSSIANETFNSVEDQPTQSLPTASIEPDSSAIPQLETSVQKDEPIADNAHPSQSNNVSEEDQQEDILKHSSKLANNLSELVLDTKRLIQQMKDEINSDIATFNEDDAAYEDDYYEDEYEDEWEGEEEEEEEWDSNEEYDVDENGDFYEYEDDDDDGSVMFSEMTIIDSANGKSHSVEQQQNEVIPVEEPPQMIMPMINMAIVRENERNSASEVSDLPLDSDFNDAMSVIEQSVGELRNMLHLTEQALGPLELTAPLHHASSVETLQNSPVQSEISEVTLMPELQGNSVTEESSERTLVAEENLPMTMKEVQTLMNAKAVIGGFLRNVQMIEQTEPQELVEESPMVIYDSVKTSSTENTTENKPSSVIERKVIVQHETIVEEPITNGHVESGLQAEAKEVSALQTPALVSSDTNLPSTSVVGMATVSILQQGVVEHAAKELQSNSAPVDIAKESEVSSNERAGTTQSEVVNTKVITGNTGPIETQSHSTEPVANDLQNSLPVEHAPPEYVNVNALEATDANLPVDPIPDYATVLKAGSRLQVIEPSAQGINDSKDLPVQTTASSEVIEPVVVKIEQVPANNLEQTHGAVESIESSGVSASNTENVVITSQTALDVEQLRAQPTSLPSEAINATEVIGPASSSLEKENIISATPLSSVQHTNTVEETQAPVELVDSLKYPVPVTDDQTSTSQQTSTITTPVKPLEPNASHLPNGHIPDERPLSRASSEEPPSSFVEIQPSQVIVHAPLTESLPQANAPPEAPPRTTNIYQNVDIHPIASSTNTTTITTTPTTITSTKSPPVRAKTKAPKLTVKVSSTAASSQSEDGASPTTPPTPTGQKAKAAASKTKPDSKKKSTSATSTTTTTTTDSSGRRLSLTRKKSVGSPFGPVQTNTVKNMQKEFLSKAKDAPKPGTSKPKPAKLVQPKAFSSAPGAALSRSSATPSSSKASTPATDGAGTSAHSTPGPSAASEPQPGSSRDPTYMCEKLMKKKYRETCFSDDYQTTDDEDESRMTVTESERTIIRSLVKPYEPNSEPPEVQAQQLLDDRLVQNLAQAELAVQLIELRYAKDNAIWAATQCHTVDEAKDLLQKECELCLGVFPLNEIVSMLKCTHTCCLECAKEYFTQEITHRSITNCNCPYCKEPDLNGPDVTEDDVLEYFSNLDILLKNIVEEGVHDLFQRKIRDRTLTQDPNFKWCVHCSSGFFARPKQRRLVCPDCGSITCASCRKPWETQHEGLTCETFAQWKEANDPELQAEGVQKHLQTHGISCPNCKFRYSLARGGCMHFTCTQCKFEFCYGCNKPFMMGAKCSVSPYCAKLGLHAHHPRNCLFYLRDKEPRDLQNLLLMNNVAFDTEPSELMKQELANGESSIMKCPIPLQKETPAGLMDMICSADVPDRHAGLCRTHYVEYLVGTVSKAQIDPLPILDLTDCVQELRRRGIELPERGPWDTDEIYREMCQKLVKDKIPLDN